MSEPRKNHLAIDGGQVKEEEHISSYKAIPEDDTEFRSSKSNLSKSKEKVSPDGAEERLLQKEEEARITTKVDMVDAKYVVGDHRNGDAKIELDANKRQFSGLTKEELMKYADDPFWVRLRWLMFVLFWALWLCMLAGAIAIIVRAPKCPPPTPKTWFEIGPLADLSSLDYAALEAELPELQDNKVQGIFVNACEDTYSTPDTPDCLKQLKAFVEKAKKYSVKVIVDLTANFVSTSHAWFKQSENGTEEFRDYFVWATGKDADATGVKPAVPNNWVSTLNEDAWTWSEVRKQYYLHQFGASQPDLNFTNPAVVRRFNDVLKMWMGAGAAGVRLLNARQLVVNASLADEPMASGRGSSPDAGLRQYSFLRHRHTSDQPQLDGLLAHWAHLVAADSSEPTVFTLAETGALSPEWFLLERNSSALRPPSCAPVLVPAADDLSAVAETLNIRLKARWPIVQLTASSPEAETELAALALLLPAAPVIALHREAPMNDTASESFARLVELRSDASVQHGHHSVAAVPAGNSSGQLLACARWKAGHTGYVAVFNPDEVELRANLTSLPSLPASLTILHVSHQVKLATNYTSNLSVKTEDVLVPGRSAVVLSYVPDTAAEK